MAKYLSAKEFRQQLPHVAEDLARWGEIVVVKRSKPQFKVVSLEDSPGDLLDRAATVDDTGQPNLEDISRIVHELRQSR